MPLMLVRLGIVLFSAVAIGIALVPILVLIDLVDGGTGWGICEAGLSACNNPYTSIGELLIILTLGFLASVFAIRLLVRLARRLRSDEYQVTQ
jgi:hypothetical protein